jgi:16S rRNA (uracil1498-N3)-methyltransferase
MNIVLFDVPETRSPLPRADARAQHVIDVLRRGVGDSFDAGLIDGPRGKATIVSLDGDQLRLDFAWGVEPPPFDPIILIVGLPRPQTSRKILEEATALGVVAMHFVATGRGEAGYARSKLWSTDEWRRHLIAGAVQAFSTRLPEVTSGLALDTVLNGLPSGACRLALDNYEAASALSESKATVPVVLALGPERGWSERERQQLRGAGFQLVHLGERVLRLETACVAAVTLVKANLGLLN